MTEHPSGRFVLIPRIYPEGGPVYWRNERSGAMADAVHAYLDHVLDRTKPAPTGQQLALVIDYCDYWVSAPCWKGHRHLQTSIKAVTTVEQLRAWIHQALAAGIDPL